MLDGEEKAISPWIEFQRTSATKIIGKIIQIGHHLQWLVVDFIHYLFQKCLEFFDVEKNNNLFNVLTYSHKVQVELWFNFSSFF